jgi:hypothetical protein
VTGAKHVLNPGNRPPGRRALKRRQIRNLKNSEAPIYIELSGENQEQPFRQRLRQSGQKRQEAKELASIEAQRKVRSLRKIEPR